MSISSALSNALTGLNVASRSAEVVSDNVANAMTPGYTRRSIDVSSMVVNGVGSGAAVTGIRLERNEALQSDRRRVDAQLGEASARADAVQRIADRMGAPGEIGALAERVTQFEAALTAATNDPGSTTVQANLLDRAKTLASTINQISTENTRIRMEADSTIEQQVGIVNSTLKEISSLNREIQMRAVSGGDTAALMDQRDQLVDRVSSILPIRTSSREDGQIALYSGNGATLVDGLVAEIGFSPTPIITSNMTIDNGMLSGLTLNGRPIPVGNGDGPLDGGSLSAQFEIRDSLAPAFDAELDALTGDLISRFQDPAIDPSMDPAAIPAQAGLFTDAGLSFDPTLQQGLASRISVNTAVDPSSGGDLWRLRDGIYAAAQGDVGENGVLVAMTNAFGDMRTPPAGSGLQVGASFAGFVSEMSSNLFGEAMQAGEKSSYLGSYNDVLRSEEASISGVDTDRELQQLILIEQAYAANARVISVADNLIRSLLEI